MPVLEREINKNIEYKSGEYPYTAPSKARFNSYFTPAVIRYIKIYIK
jgi:hypothetical protein